MAAERKFQTLAPETFVLTAVLQEMCPWFSCGVTESEAGWMCGLAKGQTGAETGHETDRGVRRPCRLTWASSSPERSRSGAAWPSLPGKRTKGRRFDTSAAPNWTRHRTQRPQSQRRG